MDLPGPYLREDPHWGGVIFGSHLVTLEMIYFGELCPICLLGVRLHVVESLIPYPDEMDILGFIVIYKCFISVAVRPTTGEILEVDVVY